MSARIPLSDPVVALPRTIGKYVVSHVIGQGAMGVVYKALDPHIQRTVALKTIRPHLLAGGFEGQAAVHRFRQEAQAAGRLSHPNIVSIYEFGETQGEVYIAMECVEGRALTALTAQGQRLPLADTMAVMLQLLDALGCAHDQRVWHCDIKPGNLLVTRDGRLKVTDFGIARIDQGGALPPSAVYGSPGYMAPERYHSPAADARVDLFACGVLLYELLTGSAPFGGNAAQAREQVLRGEPRPPSTVDGLDLPPALDAVVARAMAKNPARRFATALEMRDALLAAVPRARIRHAVSAESLVGMRRAGAMTAPSTVEPTLRVTPQAESGTERQLALTRMAAALLPVIGPMARIVVRDAARRHASLANVVSHIASTALRGDERAAFVARASRWVGQDTAPRAPATEPPVLGQTPLRADVVEQAGRLLAADIGPIALTLARRAAQQAGSCEQFFCALAAAVDDTVDGRRLLTRLWAMPGLQA